MSKRSLFLIALLTCVSLVNCSRAMRETVRTVVIGDSEEPEDTSTPISPVGDVPVSSATARAFRFNQTHSGLQSILSPNNAWKPGLNATPILRATFYNAVTNAQERPTITEKGTYLLSVDTVINMNGCAAREDIILGRFRLVTDESVVVAEESIDALNRGAVSRLRHVTTIPSGSQYLTLQFQAGEPSDRPACLSSVVVSGTLRIDPIDTTLGKSSVVAIAPTVNGAYATLPIAEYGFFPALSTQRAEPSSDERAVIVIHANINHDGVPYSGNPCPDSLFNLVTHVVRGGRVERHVLGAYGVRNAGTNVTATVAGAPGESLELLSVSLAPAPELGAYCVGSVRAFASAEIQSRLVSRFATGMPPGTILPEAEGSGTYQSNWVFASLDRTVTTAGSVLDRHLVSALVGVNMGENHRLYGPQLEARLEIQEPSGSFSTQECSAGVELFASAGLLCRAIVPGGKKVLGISFRVRTSTNMLYPVSLAGALWAEALK